MIRRIISVLKEKYNNIINGDPLMLKRNINLDIAIGKKSSVDTPGLQLSVSDSGETELIKLVLAATAFFALFSALFGVFYKKRF